MNEPKILVYDIETAGVNALSADLGYIITFGYVWLDDFIKGKRAKTISIGDFDLFNKDPHNDREIVKKAVAIMNQADGIIHHYGTKFDAPYIRSRSLFHGLESSREIPMLDTCFVSYKKLKLSSNRLANVARFLQTENQKIVKNEGWPLWWMHYLKGSLKYDKQMRTYCAADVDTLAEISLKMRPFWPASFKNATAKQADGGCSICGSKKVQLRGQRISKGKIFQRFHCLKGCGSWFERRLEE